MGVSLKHVQLIDRLALLWLVTYARACGFCGKACVFIGWKTCKLPVIAQDTPTHVAKVVALWLLWPIKWENCSISWLVVCFVLMLVSALMLVLIDIGIQRACSHKLLVLVYWWLKWRQGWVWSNSTYFCLTTHIHWAHLICQGFGSFSILFEWKTLKEKEDWLDSGFTTKH